MTKTPEEYLQEQEFRPEPEAETFSEAEKAFLEKYLGLEEPGILEKLGLEAPVEARSVPMPQPAAVEPATEPEPEVEPLAVELAPEPEALAEPEPEAVPEPEVVPEAPEEADWDAALAEEALAESQAQTVQAQEPEAEVQPQVQAEPEAVPLDVELRERAELQLVSCYVGHQEYTVPIDAVQEVVRAVKPAQVPQAPSFVAGLVNLRGRVTPLVRLDVLLGLKRAEEETEAEDRFIIVCRRKGLQVGFLVRNVATMYRVEQRRIEWNLESRLGGTVELVTALMRKPDDSLVGILSIDRIVDRLLKR